jgi:hypothetical protein
LTYSTHSLKKKEERELLSGLTIRVLDKYIFYLHTHFVPRKTRRIGGLDGQSSPICPFRPLFCPFRRCTTLRGNQRVLCSSVIFNHEPRLFLRFDFKEQASTRTKTRANHNGQLWWGHNENNVIFRLDAIDNNITLLNMELMV